MVPLDTDEFERWMAQGRSAMASADLLADVQPGWACFLYEQAAQMAVKGVLHAVGGEAWGHDLVLLVSRASEAFGSAWPDQGAAAARLARHYIPTRDPDAHPGGVPADRYSSADAAAARADSAAIVSAAEATWATLQADP